MEAGRTPTYRSVCPPSRFRSAAAVFCKFAWEPRAVVVWLVGPARPLIKTSGSQNLNASIPAVPEATTFEAAAAADTAVGNRALRPPIKTGLKRAGFCPAAAPPPGTGLEPLRLAAPLGKLTWAPKPEEEFEAATGEPRSIPLAFRICCKFFLHYRLPLNDL